VKRHEISGVCYFLLPELLLRFEPNFQDRAPLEPMPPLLDAWAFLFLPRVSPSGFDGHHFFGVRLRAWIDVIAELKRGFCDAR
jgi:hypothetical protein